jgi:hypothetical protein
MSDEQQIESKVTFEGTPSDPQKALATEMQRVIQLAQFLLRGNQAGMMIVDTFVHKCLMRAQLEVLTELIVTEKRVNTTHDEITSMIVNVLQRDLMLQQMTHQIIITPDTILKEPK